MRTGSIGVFWRELIAWTPLTTAGLVLLLASICVSLWAYHRASDLVLWLASVASIAIIAISTLSVLVVSIPIRIVSKLSPTRLGPRPRCGEPIPTGFRITVLGRFPFIETHIKWFGTGPLLGKELIRNVELVRGQEIVRPDRRGYIDSFIRELTLQDALGLAKCVIKREVRLENGVTILPAEKEPAPSDRIARPREMGGGEEQSQRGEPEGDRMEIRRHQPGDPVRFIHWKKLAQTGGAKKYVRDPERVADCRAALFFVAAPGCDEASAELADYVLREEPFGCNWIFGTSSEDGEWATSSSPEKAYESLARSNDMAMDIRLAVSNFMKFQEEASRARAAFCVIFYPAAIVHGKTGPDLPNLLDNLLMRRFYIFTGIREEKERALAEASLSALKLKPRIVRMT